MSKRVKTKIKALVIVFSLFLIVVCLKHNYDLENIDVLNQKLTYYELAIKNLKKELNDLNGYYDFKEEYDYSIAKVVNRNIYDLGDTIIVNLGSNSGVKQGMPVINTEGLVGIVSEVQASFSYVSLLNSSDCIVSVKINDSYGIYNKKLVENLKYEDTISKGDIVLTSGLTNVPANIPVGKVVEVSSDKEKIEKVAKIKLDYDLDNLNFVVIIKSEEIK